MFGTKVGYCLELVLQDDENVKSKSTTDDDNLIRNAH